MYGRIPDWHTLHRHGHFCHFFYCTNISTANKTDGGEVEEELRLSLPVNVIASLVEPRLHVDVESRQLNFLIKNAKNIMITV